MNKMALLIVMSALAACASNKNSEDKSVLNKANGENYSANTTIESVPLMKSNNRWTTINGKIIFANPTFDQATGIQKVQLLKEGKVVLQTTSTADGAFQFKGKIENGNYFVKVDSKTLVGSAPLKITDYEIKNFILPATLSAPTE